jgi:hypothetical protein
MQIKIQRWLSLLLVVVGLVIGGCSTQQALPKTLVAHQPLKRPLLRRLKLAVPKPVIKQVTQTRRKSDGGAES